MITSVTIVRLQWDDLLLTAKLNQTWPQSLLGYLILFIVILTLFYIN